MLLETKSVPPKSERKKAVLPPAPRGSGGKGVAGPGSFLGAPEAKTLEMLVEEQNKKGGVLGRKIELIVKDSGASPEKAFSFAKQLIEEDKVFAIIGPSTSGETMKIKGVAAGGE